MARLVTVTDGLTFSSRILSPHATSNSLSIKIRSSEVTFHWWLAKCTTAKSLPYWPVAISSFTFPTTSGGAGGRGRVRTGLGRSATHDPDGSRSTPPGPSRCDRGTGPRGPCSLSAGQEASPGAGTLKRGAHSRGAASSPCCGQCQPAVPRSTGTRGTWGFSRPSPQPHMIPRSGLSTVSLTLGRTNLHPVRFPVFTKKRPEDWQSKRRGHFAGKEKLELCRIALGSTWKLLSTQVPASAAPARVTAPVEP